MALIESSAASRLALPTVTLCAATSVNVDATLTALRASLNQVEFEECLLFTDAVVPEEPRIRVIPIAPLDTAEDYSRFILDGLAEHISSDHCLIVQWDGFVLNANQWDATFLEYDYIGAPWPQFKDSHNVGNGGFSLRSRKLLEACRDPRFRADHPEDVAICRTGRTFLENQYGIRFAGVQCASRFAFERSKPRGPTFGYHGVFNMIPALGPERFWKTYRTLNDRKTAFVDYWRLLRQLGAGSDAMKRRIWLTFDYVIDIFRRF